MKPTHRGGTSIPRITAIVFSLLVGACATTDANPDASLIARIQNASTSADHMSLAEQYEREANTSRQKVAQHRKMYEAYRGRAGVGRGGPELQTSILRHCENLITQNERAALEYDGLIMLHRRLAEEAKK